MGHSNGATLGLGAASPTMEGLDAAHWGPSLFNDDLFESTLNTQPAPSQYMLDGSFYNQVDQRGLETEQQHGRALAPVPLAAPIPAVPVHQTRIEQIDRKIAANSLRGSKSTTPKLSTSSTTTTTTSKATKSQKRDAKTTSSKKKTKEEQDEEAKKMQRMLKNREIARNCRKRKRERMQMFEQEVVRLREVNRQLELKLNKGNEGKDREDLRKVKIEKLRTLLNECDEENSTTRKKQKKSKSGDSSSESGDDSSSNAPASEIKNIMHRYAEMYSDFGNERRIAINFHLESLRTLLIPTQVSKMLFWTLGQKNEAFYDDQQPESQQVSGGGLWNLIGQACRFTADQKKKILKSRASWETERENVSQCLNILSELKNRVDNNFVSLRTQMNTLMKITSPSQQARFLLWIEENQACMHMLNNLWQSSNSNLDTVKPTPVPAPMDANQVASAPLGEMSAVDASLLVRPETETSDMRS